MYFCWILNPALLAIVSNPLICSIPSCVLNAVKHITILVPGFISGRMFESQLRWSSDSSSIISSRFSFGTIELCGFPRYPSVIIADRFSGMFSCLSWLASEVNVSKALSGLMWNFLAIHSQFSFEACAIFS